MDCSKCEAYLAKQDAWSIEKRNKAAKVWAEKYDNPTLTGENMLCDGCKSNGKLFMHCTKCDIRKKNLK